MTDGRETLKRELEKAALAYFEAMEQMNNLDKEHTERMKALCLQNSEDTKAIGKSINAAESRLALLKEALRLVDEEGVEPLIAKLTANPAQHQIKRAYVFDGVPESTKAYNHSKHQMRMHNARYVAGKGHQ
ncbi:hypothetical protein [Novosphingobium guangzhouense]|uniref:Uncharacterized protein n=1 Tax=Novosphingobium guangzhouense TaxID=1850347 RepID=A0A2K2G0M6_9SPHN|nr:hypothetical protein [Novosphingobium guangzhouense]PNU04596.1 hypothetical protein A8V01_19500 [Novosphingobium guangzhouense]